MTRVALIGGGEFVTAYGTVQARAPNIEFTAIVNSSPGTARRMARLLGARITAVSLENLLERHAAAFDAAVIHEFGDTRAALVEQIARAGKHVLVASPPGGVG